MHDVSFGPGSCFFKLLVHRIEDPLHVDLLCSGDQRREGLPRAALRGRDHHVRLRAGLDDGEVKSSPVRGVLYVTHQKQRYTHNFA